LGACGRAGAWWGRGGVKGNVDSNPIRFVDVIRVGLFLPPADGAAKPRSV
jgi:hypothetical protein